ncbi:MAG TPA: glycine betaine ABC transporter substrate-binding protein, partial [Micromonospora sp.]|nr:glycine betaine ABC transporter substrate-binding protein [Micromonospora sp.]
MWSRKLLRRIALAATAALALTGAAACGDDASGGSGDKKNKITIGYMPWDEAIATSYLWSNILEAKGYQVELKNVGAGVVYQGLADGDIDLFL